jgi:hypothetical protein
LPDKVPEFIKKCWKCAKGAEPSWFFCCYCGAKLLSLEDSPTPEHKTDVAFLQDLYNYAWYNRYDTAISLYDSVIEAPRIIPQYKIFSAPSRFQRILAAKIFNEYMALLEAFGMLCISIYNRKSTSLRWSYVNTKPSDVTQFYQKVENIKRLKLDKLLNFPQIKVVFRAAENIGLSEKDMISIQEGYKKILENIQLIAEQYLNKRGLLVRNYNKLKHGFTLIEGQWIDPPLDSNKIAIYSFDEVCYLSMRQQDVIRQIENMKNITLMGGELMALCLALDKIGMLFEDLSADREPEQNKGLALGKGRGVKP